MSISTKKLTERQRQMRDELLRMEEHRRGNLIEFLYKPRKWGGLMPNPKQEIILEAWKNPLYDEFVFASGNRAGKTTLLCWIVICTMAGKWLWSMEPMKFPHGKPRKCRIVGQGWEDHIKKLVIPELKKWWPQVRPLKTEKNNFGVEHIWIDKMTGSTLDIMSNQQASDQHESGYYDLVAFDEPPKRDIYISNARGLVDRLGKAFIAATLLKEPWIDQEIVRKLDEDGNPDMSVFSVMAESWDNVGYGITKEGLDKFIKKLSPEEIEARIKGIPSYRSGLVCYNFKRRVHVIERFPIPSDWLVDIQIDVHPRKEQAVLFTAIAPDQRKYSCFSIWDHGSAEWLADEIVRIVNTNALRVNRVAIDPLSKGDSNPQAGETTYSKIRDRLSRHNMILEVGSKDKDSGIRELNTHMMGPNKEPSWFIFRDMPVPIRQIEGWMYEDKGENMGKPSKKDDDFCECLYRTMLLNTVWYPPEEFEDGEEAEPTAVDEQTGY